MIQLMPIVIQRGNRTNDLPYRGYSPDLHTKNPGFGVKGGIVGSLQQPAEYLGEYAWRHYGGAEKTRALALKAQHDIPPWLRNVIWRHGSKRYQYAKTLSKSKKNGSSKLSKDIQKGTKFRASKSRSYKGRFPTKFRHGQSCYWSKRTNRWSCSNRRYY